jgi:hypothetical protein
MIDVNNINTILDKLLDNTIDLIIQCNINDVAYLLTVRKEFLRIENFIPVNGITIVVFDTHNLVFDKNRKKFVHCDGCGTFTIMIIMMNYVWHDILSLKEK